AQRVLVDKVPVMVAGGLESVSLVQGPPGGNKNRLVNPWVQEHVPGIYHSMIQTADTVAARYNISREYQDEYSLQSQLGTAGGQARRQVGGEDAPMETPEDRPQQKPPGDLKEALYAGKGGGHPPGYAPRGPGKAAAGEGPRQVDPRRQRQPAQRRRVGRR